MIFLAKPSISPYLARALFELGESVVLTDSTAVVMRPALLLREARDLISDSRAVYRDLLLTNSENALSFLFEHFPNDDRVLKAALFKDKVKFRQALSKSFPGLFFCEKSFSELEVLDSSKLPYPVVLKPSVGISSVGVIRVEGKEEWGASLAFLDQDIKKYSNNYASKVIDTQRFIVESYIEGRELAIDGYFDQNAEPIVLNILEHLFENDRDTSDRVYVTHRNLIREFLAPLKKFLRTFGDVFDLKRFPFHLEVRVSRDGGFVPIELNPLRFSGLGTTEIAEYAYGVNVYKSFFNQSSPNWEKIIAGRDESIYAFACLDVPTAIFRQPGLEVLDRKLFKSFTEILDYRLLDEEETSTFAVVFFRCEDESEPKRVLSLALESFLRVN